MNQLSPLHTLQVPAAKAARNSNIELLRIISMLMILGLHVNVFSLGVPTHEETILYPLPSFARCAFEMICIISVNLFVLISGWFSIRFRLMGLAKFLFQVIFILSLKFWIGIILGYIDFSMTQFLECFFLMGNAWFITSYIGLFILSPLLNSFCENASEKQLRLILILFFLFQTIWGNIFYFTKDFVNGYSTLSFIGLYLLARYLRLYGQNLVKYAKVLYLCSTIFLILLYYIPLLFNLPKISWLAFLYTCPFNISGAAGLLLWVGNFKSRTSPIINFVSSSVFSVYLCHMCNSWISNLYRRFSQQLYTDYSGLKYLFFISIFILTIFILSIAVDQLRKLSWHFLLSIKERKSNFMLLSSKV